VGSKKGENTMFNFDTSRVTAKYQPQDALNLAELELKKVDISIIYYVNDKKWRLKKMLTISPLNWKEQN
jgi:hypothetical protein